MFRYLRVLASALVFALAVRGAAAYAQDSRELSEDARKQYATALREASTLVKDRQFAAAEPKLDKLIAERPREPQARFLKGVVETEQGRTDAAITIFQALIEDYPELPEPYNNLAVIYAQKGDFENARTALETAVRTAPNWAVAHENLGDVYVRLGGAEYDRAAKLDRENKTAPAKLVLVRDLLKSSATSKPKS